MAVSLNAAVTRSQVSVGWRTNIEPRWSFDLDAIRQACEFLGVRERVVVGCAEYANGRWGGMYSWDERLGGVHKIRVKRAASAEGAGRILWHELTHAAQRERDGRSAGTRTIRREQGLEAYRSHPAEVEARHNESYVEDLQLTRASG